MEKANKYLHLLSETALLMLLGSFIKQTRLQQNKTQQQVAEAAGINRSTMVQIERGGSSTLLSFIQILRALEQLQLLEHFEIKPQISPLQLAKLDQHKRQRASIKKTDGITKNKSDW